jgi:hypothetical protein
LWGFGGMGRRGYDGILKTLIKLGDWELMMDGDCGFGGMARRDDGRILEKLVKMSSLGGYDGR